MIERAKERFLAFRIGQTAAAVPLSLVREVVASPALIPVPGSRTYVAGITLHGGVAVPAYDLQRFDRLWPDAGGNGSKPVSEASHLIVCNWGEALIGLLGSGIDLLEDPEKASDGDAVGAILCNEYLSGYMRRGGEAVAVFNAAALFPSLGVPDLEMPVAREDGGEEDPSGR